MATIENQPPDQQSTGAHSERLLRAQAAELAALRERVADLPDPDTLTTWRASHERLQALQQDLPQWREQLQQAHQAEQARLQQTVEQQAQALTHAQLQQEVQREFLTAGGNAQLYDVWRELAGKHASRGEDGTLQINGQPLSDALAGHRSDPVLAVAFHPRYGAGGGARSGMDGRVVNQPDLSKMSTSQLFRMGFVKRSGVTK